MSQNEPIPEAKHSRRRRWSRLALLAFVVAGLFLFPGLRRAEIEFRYEIERPKCIERLELRLFEGDVLARQHRQLVEGRQDLAYVAKLRHGEYRAIVNLECTDGFRATASRQPIIVDRDGVIQFKVSGDECGCSAGR
jgi:hypothetical protein